MPEIQNSHKSESHVTMDKILVAGAGPAGLIAALKLARAGKSITLLAPKQNIKTLGECVPGAINRLLSQLELPLIDARDGVHRRVGGAMSLWAGNVQTDDYMNRAEGCAWRLDKARFLEAIAEIATVMGVKRKYGRIRQILNLSEANCQVQLDDGETMAVDFVVDATGRHARVARASVNERSLGDPLVANWMVGKATSNPTTNRTIVESVSDGWWYAAFLPDRRPLAMFLTSPETSSRLRHGANTWSKFLARTQLVSNHLTPSAFPNHRNLESKEARFSRINSCFGAGWASCGDAAMSFDPISAQGIFNAMATGSMVADALLCEDHTSSLQRYQQKISEIARICERRRSRYYESAYLHFRSGFWKQIHQA